VRVTWHILFTLFLTVTLALFGPFFTIFVRIETVIYSTFILLFTYFMACNPDDVINASHRSGTFFMVHRVYWRHQHTAHGVLHRRCYDRGLHFCLCSLPCIFLYLVP